MARTTDGELGQLARMINHRLGLVHHIDPDKDPSYYIQRAYGQPRLVRAGGSIDVSPRLPAGQLAQWMRAFIAGIDAGRGNQ